MRMKSSNKFGSNFSPFLNITFMTVKNIVIRAINPIPSEDNIVEANNTPIIEMKINLSVF